MTLAWMELLPQQLPTLNGRGMATLLALCWNLGENLDRQPAWLRCLFREVCEQEGSGIDVSAAVDRVAVMAMEPAAPGTKEAVWLDFAKRDLWFFPGEIHALAPGVLCVHDREGRGSAQGVCLGSHVQVMGPTGCREEGPFSGLTRLPKPRPAGLRDISIGRVYHCVTQSGWSAMSLRYSQRLLMVKSGPDSG
jgi:hypothetical protein